MLTFALLTLTASAALVALAEFGDKTMLLAIVLASRFRQPWRIVAGIFVATVVNHILAALVGKAAAGLLTSFWFRVSLALGFIAMAGWSLIPERLNQDDSQATFTRYGGAFFTTTIAWFFVEMGDKTQIATMALAARFHNVTLVAIGTTLGMMIVDAPAVFFGDRIIAHISLRSARLIAAVMFFGLGAWQLTGLFRAS